MVNSVELEILTLNAEELRREICQYDSKVLELRQKQFEEKFKDINKMLIKQIKINKNWES